jgi:hypothetical protein
MSSQVEDVDRHFGDLEGKDHPAYSDQIVGHVLVPLPETALLLETEHNF